MPSIAQRKLIKTNLDRLSENSYPGRGMVLGATIDHRHLVQIYWIMGRSENSRNRIFVEDKGTISTQAYNPEKLSDPSLIIYEPIKVFDHYHIITNGDQTQTITNSLQEGQTFEAALMQRKYEPDPPHFTPRISAVHDIKHSKFPYTISILKSFMNNTENCLRHFYYYQCSLPGLGHCITTYSGDANPLPSFEGEPFLVNTFNDQEETAQFYWDLLNIENRVSLIVKFIEIATMDVSFTIINRHQ